MPVTRPDTSRPDTPTARAFADVDTVIRSGIEGNSLRAAPAAVKWEPAARLRTALALAAEVA
jgi:hypothetical protein